ncbi:MAG TPA: methyltransferase domain-containing protein [Candidatus Dormibacteraeota bacterium]|nr:methyltransferase domain-containing protein [Candidatus Dormibacteraeota bacterium]
MQSLMILGRQPALGIAELESLYGAHKIRPIGNKAALVDIDPCLMAFDRLGGSMKFCKVLDNLPTTDWSSIEAYLISQSPGHAESLPKGKLRIGLSSYGLGVNNRQLAASGLKIKRAISLSGRSVRLIPNNEPALNSAQVLHNKLCGPNGWELVFVSHNQQTIIAQTVKVQDITSYALRDRGRPKRDSRIGMLPPKLAQIIINLAVGKLIDSQLISICDQPDKTVISEPDLKQTILDPFCGTGIILQEARLMGYRTYGTDREPRMVDFSKQNLEWFDHQFRRQNKHQSQFEIADATNYEWQLPIDFVASETYLGRPFSSQPAPQILTQTMGDCEAIIKKFLLNIQHQLKPGARLCIAVPAWQVKPDQFKVLPLIDQISQMGYNRLSFEHLGDKDLFYYRPDQIVARQLLVLSRK